MKEQFGYSRKNPNTGVEDMEFLGVNEKRSGISKSDQKKVIRNFHGSLSLALEFPRNLRQFYGISRG